MLEGFCFAALFCLFFFHVVTFCMFPFPFVETNNKERASRQTHMQGNNKNNEGKQGKAQTPF
jgi:hypothetical protein